LAGEHLRNHSLNHRPGTPINHSKTMSQPIHAPTPSSYRGVIRYSFCILTSALASAFALDSLIGLLWLLFSRIHCGFSGVPNYSWDGGFALLSRFREYQIFWNALPMFLWVAVAMITWHFRMKR
jgi:hypothetical protein